MIDDKWIEIEDHLIKCDAITYVSKIKIEYSGKIQYYKFSFCVGSKEVVMRSNSFNHNVLAEEVNDQLERLKKIRQQILDVL